MISRTDSQFTYEIDKYFLIVPPNWDQAKIELLYKQKTKRIRPGSSYNSGESTNFLSVEELRKLIKENLESDFAPI